MGKTGIAITILMMFMPSLLLRAAASSTPSLLSAIHYATFQANIAAYLDLSDADALLASVKLRLAGRRMVDAAKARRRSFAFMPSTSFHQAMTLELVSVESHASGVRRNLMPTPRTSSECLKTSQTGSHEYG
eukprot:TRINITY_DN70503_c0_g1_i1.p2 TRINITY_DN70503_c0_g1~~TRINITY_DN70503_c0_g1_i1.p2  ORF type:complete len:132 (-),score=14.50 TRINITY_DN70503_c0_g1_i1:124-519(-)